jgi:large subunit ribosomal protein L30
MAKAKTEAVKSTAALPSTAIVRITLVRSPIGYSKRHKETVQALGLRRMRQTVEHVDSPTLRGMIYIVSHLVEVSSTAVLSTAEEA